MHLILFACFLAALASKAFAEDCTGVEYKPKQDQVPVFEEPDRTSAVIYRLKLGERICVVGAQAEFAIVDWSLHSACCEGLKEDQRLVFVIENYLWPISRTGVAPVSRDVFSRARRFVNQLRFGEFVDDPLLPFRSLGSDSKNTTDK